MSAGQTATSANRSPYGGANALYLALYYIGATFGSVLPGYAWRLCAEYDQR